MNENQKEMAAMAKAQFNVPSVQRTRFQEIHIKPADNKGFIVRVGCKEFIFKDDPASISDMCDYIKEYLKHPFEVERELMKRQYDVMCAHDQLTGNVVAETCTAAPPMPDPCNGSGPY